MADSAFILDPLFSTIISLYTLVLLYFPSKFLGIFSSAVIISTSLLLLSLLRLSVHQQSNRHQNLREDSRDPIVSDHALLTSSTGRSKIESDSVQLYTDSFVKWDVGAPLEVIHESYEGEGDDTGREASVGVLERYDSLSKFYPETDSDRSSSEEEDFTVIREWELPENPWEVEEKEEMIEIEFEEEDYEENLIEIDLNPVSSLAT